MKHLLLVIMLALAIVTPAASKTLHIALDISGSMPLVTSDAFAARTAARIQAEVKQLNTGDHVQLRFLGAYGLAANLKRLDVKIGKRNRAPQVAEYVGATVAAIPRLIREKKLEAQRQSSIVGYFESESSLLSCTAQATEILLISDGVEHSARTNGHDFLAGKIKLPAPREGLLKDCGLTILGIGQFPQGAQEVYTQRLEGEWQRWAKAAGVSRYASYPHF